jgi:ribosomal-protein-alanine N-acetyltransferase
VNALETSRLRLTPFSIVDADELFLVRGDTIAMQYWDWPGDLTIDDTRAAAKRFLVEIEAEESAYWTVRNADSDFIGVFDLSELKGGDEADLGFMIRRCHWGMGYAFEAALAIVIEAWARGFTSLKARAHSGNERSIKLLSRLGFKQVQTRAVETRRGVLTDCTFFSLHRNSA